MSVVRVWVGGGRLYVWGAGGGMIVEFSCYCYCLIRPFYRYKYVIISARTCAELVSLKCIEIFGAGLVLRCPDQEESLLS